MEKDMLRKVQLAQLSILKEVKRVCESNDIHYFLDSGTLLGAVRHKGFIPWDDDLDIGMLYEDYERFLAIAPEAIGDKFVLETWDSDPAYPFPFSKVMLRDTIYIEDAFADTERNNGVYIDVFPYFPRSENPREINKTRHRVEHFRRLEYMISGMRPWVRHNNWIKRLLVRIKYFPALIVSKFVNKSTLNKKYYYELRRHVGSEFKYYVPGGISKYGKWKIPNQCFRELILLDFEDDKFSCPVGYDEYLRHAYGDYMTLPPENERENRHHIVEVKL